MKLLMTKQALKAVKQLDAKQYKQVVSTILSLCANDKPNDSIALKGASNGERRVDIGEYRIIYTINNEFVIEILVVGKRNDDEVYKIFERQK